MSKAVGIDLGTTYLVLLISLTIESKLLMTKVMRTTPSFVAFTDTERLIGDAAKIKLL